MVEGGMTPLQAITCGTRESARLLGRDADIGTLEAGKFADAVVVQGDPLGDIALLAEPDRVRMVIKDGQPAKDLTMSFDKAGSLKDYENNKSR